MQPSSHHINFQSEPHDKERAVFDEPVDLLNYDTAKNDVLAAPESQAEKIARHTLDVLNVYSDQAIPVTTPEMQPQPTLAEHMKSVGNIGLHLAIYRDEAVKNG